MAPAAPTPEGLYAALRALWPELSEENVARELRIGTNTIRRLKRGEGIEFPTTVMLLERVGWLDVEGDGHTAMRRAERQRLLSQARRLAEATTELVRALEESL